MNSIVRSGVIIVCGVLPRMADAAEPYTYTKREASEWCNISIADARGTPLPRVLLMGDSHAGRYSSAVRQALKDKASLSTLLTSKPIGDPALPEIITWVLRQNSYAVVHFGGFHNGPDCRSGFPELIAALKRHAPGAKLIWANTTPSRSEGMTRQTQEKNRIAAEFLAKEDIPINDLYALIADHPTLGKASWDPGGIHHTEEAYALQAKQVTQLILRALPAKPGP